MKKNVKHYLFLLFFSAFIGWNFSISSFFSWFLLVLLSFALTFSRIYLRDNHPDWVKSPFGGYIPDDEYVYRHKAWRQWKRFVRIRIFDMKLSVIVVLLFFSLLKAWGLGELSLLGIVVMYLLAAISVALVIDFFLTERKVNKRELWTQEFILTNGS